MEREIPKIKFCAVLLALTLPLSAIGADREAIRLSEPVEVTDSYEAFGSKLSSTGEELSLAELIADSENYQDSEVLLSTRIAKVCQKKGCFFIAQEGADSVRITFADYGFFIPTDSGGKRVTLAGIFTREPLSQQQAEHYAKDLGEAVPATAPAYEYTFVATGIRIYKS